MFPISIAGGVRLAGHLDPDAVMRRLVAGLEDAEADDVRADDAFAVPSRNSVDFIQRAAGNPAWRKLAAWEPES